MEIRTALTYDDVLIVPKKSFIKSRKDVDTSCKLSKNLKLNIPIISANMDTVTESRMAIAMAKLGGIGIIHRFCSIESQVKEVLKVKRYQSMIIRRPFVVNPNNTIKELKAKVKEFGYSGFLVSDDENVKLLGIITKRDYILSQDDDLLVKDLMTPHTRLITANSEISIDGAKEIFSKHKIEKLPIVDENFNIKGLITKKDLVENFDYNLAAKDKQSRLLVGAAIGVNGDFMERVDALVEAEVDIIDLDIAHGHSVIEIEALKLIKAKYPNLEIMAGNIATSQAAKDLIEAGADCVKVGIGPGSTCTTRITTGFGVPQLTAIMDIYPVCKELGVPMIADGGIKQPGDLVKAMVAGADTVMLGGQLSGTEETPGPTINYNGRQYKISRGMASLTAALSRPGANENVNQITPEGVEAKVPYRGAVKEVIGRYIGGLRSGMSYGNSETIEELRECELIRITNSGMRESNSHDNEVL
ncbi:MAG: IMP dehydrogenase [Patescibacteria group bacterium]|nr:IMP dehydrogenase [Patescibacteria group bacterium]MDD4304352.1 IMP dehydrogenase [Patescibacteria group bacterium]MDD4695375.1 IMP dehydrogenase [Patescibacteria group bacterium]